MKAGNPAYQSEVQPLKRKCGSNSSRRNAGDQTWAPRSPPAGVESLIQSHGRKFQITNSDTAATTKTVMAVATARE